MTIDIPNWVIGTTGAFFIFLATVTGIISDRVAQSKLAKKKKDLFELERKTDNAWDNLKQAESRGSCSVHSVGLYLMSKADPQFYLANAAQDLRGAVLSLYVSSGKDVLPKVPDEIMVLESQLSGGDLRAFEKMNVIIDNLRLDAMRYMNKIAIKRRAVEQEIFRLENIQRLWSKIFIGFNMFGLSVVLLKDMPIWKV